MCCRRVQSAETWGGDSQNGSVNGASSPRAAAIPLTGSGASGGEPVSAGLPQHSALQTSAAAAVLQQLQNRQLAAAMAQASYGSGGDAQGEPVHSAALALAAVAAAAEGGDASFMRASDPVGGGSSLGRGALAGSSNGAMARDVSTEMSSEQQVRGGRAAQSARAGGAPLASARRSPAACEAHPLVFFMRSCR